jgi:hypothetical protein
MPMDMRAIAAHFRELVGNKTESQCSVRTVETFVGDAVDELADVLDYARRTDVASLALVADQYEYTRPTDVNEVLWVKWNGTELHKATREEWVNYGVEWRSATSGTPTEFAVDGNKFLVYPPPSSDAITTDPNIDYEYIAPGFPITPAGIPGMRDSDVRIAIYMAAQAYCLAHPEDPANQTRAASYGAIINRRMPDARDRAQQPIRDYSVAIAPPSRGTAAR